MQRRPALEQAIESERRRATYYQLLGPNEVCSPDPCLSGTRFEFTTMEAPGADQDRAHGTTGPPYYPGPPIGYPAPQCAQPPGRLLW